MKRLFINLFGCILTIIGSIFIISYLNLLSVGYNFLDYVYFIIRRVECLLFIIGICILLFNNKGGI